MKVPNRKGSLVQIQTLLRNLSHHETFRFSRALTVCGVQARLFAKLDSHNNYVIVATNNLDEEDAMALYAKRWEIETLFSCFKGRGFNLEDTHLTNMARMSRLVAICAIAFCWAYNIGSAEAGIYMVAVQLTAAIGIIFDAINKVYVPWLFEQLKKDISSEKRRIVKLIYIWFVS